MGLGRIPMGGAGGACKGGVVSGLLAKLRSPGRPKAEVTKERITIRLSPDVLSAFRASGSGWQTRMDAALRDWLRDHPVG